MSLIQEPASYRGVVVEHATGASSSGLAQLEIKLRALQKYDFDDKEWIDWTNREDCEIKAFLVMFDSKNKPIFHVKDIQRVFEWDGASLIELNALDLEGAEVQFEVISEIYQEKPRIKVARIGKYDDVPGTGGVKKLDPDELAKLNTKYATALKALSGGPKAASAKTTKTTTNTTTATGKTAVKTTATATTPPPPPPAKTEEQATADAAAPVAEPVAENKVNKPTPPPAPGKTAPAAPPAPPKAPATKAATEVVKGRKLTYVQAWAECCEKRLPTVDDKALGVSFTGAMHRIAPNKVEEITADTPEGTVEISGEEWGQIADAVLGECGGS